MKREFRSRERRFHADRKISDCVPCTVAVLLDKDYLSLPLPGVVRASEPFSYATADGMVEPYMRTLGAWADMYSDQLREAGHDFGLRFRTDAAPRRVPHLAGVICQGLYGAGGHMVIAKNGQVVFDPNDILVGRPLSHLSYVGWFEVT